VSNLLTIQLGNYEFLSPHWLGLLLLVPIFLWRMFVKDSKRKGEMVFSKSESDQAALELPWIATVRKALFYAYALIFILLIIAFARPYNWKSTETFDHKYKYGIDIILAMDISASMLAKDFEPDRLAVSKHMAKEFVDGRVGDRIGLIVYEGEAYTACPATLDYEILKAQIDNAQPGNLEGGTAIGTGLGTAVTRLRNDSIKSKVIILLTDGSNNSGTISPETAANLARQKHVCVYTIGVGSIGMAPTPMMTPLGIQYVDAPVEIDEETLQNIANITGGKYFRATNEQSLREIYKSIDTLEKQKIEQKNYNSEPPTTPEPFIITAIILLFATLVVKRIVLKTNE
jgi:Ca-activated chloride channel family protein